MNAIVVRRHILTIEKVDSGENALSFSRCLFVLEYRYFDGASQDLERCCQMRSRLAIGPNIDSITWPGVEGEIGKNSHSRNIHPVLLQVCKPFLSDLLHQRARVE